MVAMVGLTQYLLNLLLFVVYVPGGCAAIIDIEVKYQAYSFKVDGELNPALTLYRGNTYNFNVDSPGHPFWIKTLQTTGTGNGYDDVTDNGQDQGQVSILVGDDTPTELYYICQYHGGMTGVITMQYENMHPAPNTIAFVAAPATAAWVVDGLSNPTMYLQRGRAYLLLVDNFNHPLWVKTHPTLGSDDRYDEGLSDNGQFIGDYTFTVPMNAPSLLWYICGNHDGMAGRLVVGDNPPGPGPDPTPAPVIILPEIELTYPEEVSSVDGVLEYDLYVGMADHDYGHPGLVSFRARSYNGAGPGPTFRLRPGDVFKLTLHNDLEANPEGCQEVHNQFRCPNTTNMHTHGLHVSPLPGSDDVLTHVEPGHNQTYTYKIRENHEGGTHWYHPHVHGSTAVQVMSGMAGALIIEGYLDEIPEVAAAVDHIMLIQDSSWDDLKSMELASGCYGSQADANAAYDSAKRFMSGIEDSMLITVNGLFKPRVPMRPGEAHRFRFVSGRGHDYLHISLDGHDLYQLAIDGVPDVGPVNKLSFVFLPPGGRVDVMVIARSEPGEYRLQVNGSGFYEFLDNGFFGLEPYTAMLATMVIGGEPIEPPMKVLEYIPDQLPRYLRPITKEEVVQTRVMDFEINDGFNINGSPFNGTVLFTMELGTVEEWIWINHDGVTHPIHIHVNHFYVVEDSNDEAPSRDSPWQDVVALPAHGNVTMRTRFSDYVGKFVVHCHILAHEDRGMMALVEVVDRRSIRFWHGKEVLYTSLLVGVGLIAAATAACCFVKRRKRGRPGGLRLLDREGENKNPSQKTYGRMSDTNDPGNDYFNDRSVELPAAQTNPPVRYY